MTEARHGWGGFLYLLAAATLSAGGSHLTSFALGVWIYQQTDSTTWFALLGLCGLLPCVLAWPLAGVVVDRLGAGTALVVGQAGAGACILSIAIAAPRDADPSLSASFADPRALEPVIS